MKKYIAASAPFVICLILAIILSQLKPVDYHDPRYPYRSAEALRGYFFMYIFVGALISAMLSCALLIDDLLKLFQRNIEDRSTNTNNKILSVITGSIISIFMTLIVVALLRRI